MLLQQNVYPSLNLKHGFLGDEAKIWLTSLIDINLETSFLFIIGSLFYFHCAKGALNYTMLSKITSRKVFFLFMHVVGEQRIAKEAGFTSGQYRGMLT